MGVGVYGLLVLSFTEGVSCVYCSFVCIQAHTHAHTHPHTRTYTHTQPNNHILVTASVNQHLVIQLLMMGSTINMSVYTALDRCVYVCVYDVQWCV